MTGMSGVTPQTLGLIAGGLILAWVFGGFFLRLGGLVLVLLGIGGLALSSEAGGALIVALGALVWLAGHWHYAVRHQHFKSPLARLFFTHWAPEWLDPSEHFAATWLERDEVQVAGIREPGEARGDRRGLE